MSSHRGPDSSSAEELPTRAVQKWFAYVVAGCPSLEVLRQSHFLAGEGEAGDFY